MSVMLAIYVLLDFVCGGWALTVIVPFLSGQMAKRGWLLKRAVSIPFIVAGVIAALAGYFLSSSLVFVLCVGAIIINFSRR